MGEVPSCPPATSNVVVEAYRELENWVDEVKNEMGHQNEPPPLVYHYTSLDAMYAMAEPGLRGIAWARFWATSMAHLNDKQEFHHGHKIMQAAWNDLIETERDGPLKQVLIDARDSMEKEELHWYALGVFVSSFSANGDQLGQWRGYGDFGKGVSIGVCYQRLIERVDARAFWVIYDPDVQRQVATRVLRNLRDRLDQVVTEHNLQSAKAEVKVWIPGLMSLMYAMLKHPAFAEEREFRLARAEGPYVSVVDLRFRARRGALVPYVELRFHESVDSPMGCRIPIKEVILGPNASSVTNMASTQMFFATYGAGLLEVGAAMPVRASEVPLA